MERRLMFPLLALGLSSAVTLILVLREFLSISQGNELSLGVVLGTWMLFAGIGAYIGRLAERVSDKAALFAYCLAIIGILPLAAIFCIRQLKNVLLMPEPFAGLIVFSSLALAPFCLLSGAMLSIAGQAYSARKHDNPIGRVHLMLAAGGTIGASVFAFLLVFSFNAVQTAVFIGIICLVAAFALVRRHRALAYSILALLVMLIVVFMAFDINEITTEALYKDQRVVMHKQSVYGTILVTGESRQLSFFLNSVLLFGTGTSPANEEAAHYALAQTPYPREVLLISGAPAAPEILKHAVWSLDYAEPDPTFVTITKSLTGSLDDERINAVSVDAGRFVRTTDKTYDAVIIGLPGPANLQLNRFYTTEFFQDIRKVLKSNGVLSLSLPHANEDFYLQEQNAAVYGALAQVFPEIMAVPGERLYIIASDRELDYGISRLLRQRSIETMFMDEQYLSLVLTDDRIVAAERSLAEPVPANTRFNGIRHLLNAWQPSSRASLLALLLPILAAASIPLWHRGRVRFAIFTTGFAAAGLQLAIIIALQAMFGSAFYMIGLIIACTLLGTALGSFFMSRMLSRMRRRDLALLEAGIGIFAVLLPFVILWLPHYYGQALLCFLSFALALLAGLEFPLAGKLFAGRVPHKLYSPLLLGASGGALLCVLMLPYLGILQTCIAIGLLNLLSALFLARK